MYVYMLSIDGENPLVYHDVARAREMAEYHFESGYDIAATVVAQPDHEWTVHLPGRATPVGRIVRHRVR